MKKLLALLTMLATLPAYASTDVLDCPEPVKIYKNGTAVIQICRESRGSLKFRAHSTGSTGQNCGMRGTAVFDKKAYAYKREQCEVRLSFVEEHLDATFSEGCRHENCGTNAEWSSGTFAP
jgi:hypothetical protein